jgi:hypothetical protein
MMSFFNSLGPASQNPMNGFQNVMQRFQQFQQAFKGNAGQTIQQMMNSGKVNQGMYNQAVQMAQQFQKMLGGK